jgi:hypothetical protein
MKAIIKVCTANKAFNQDQLNILRRVTTVLQEHNLSVAVTLKIKENKQLKLKVS